MNTLGKTLVAIGVCIVVFLSLFLTRDLGAPAGRAGDGFGTMRESLEDGIGASYSIEGDIGHVAFDDGVIYITKTKDQKIALSYLFLNSQGTKYYLDAYYIISDVENTQWYSSENDVKTNYRITAADEVISQCDNLPVEFEEYTVTLEEEEMKIKLYYNRAE